MSPSWCAVASFCAAASPPHASEPCRNDEQDGRAGQPHLCAAPRNGPGGCRVPPDAVQHRPIGADQPRWVQWGWTAPLLVAARRSPARHAPRHLSPLPAFPHVRAMMGDHGPDAFLARSHPFPVALAERARRREPQSGTRRRCFGIVDCCARSGGVQHAFVQTRRSCRRASRAQGWQATPIANKARLGDVCEAPQQSAPTTPPATSSPRTCPAWRSVASTAQPPPHTRAVPDLVQQGQIHYLIVGGQHRGGPGQSQALTTISQWVQLTSRPPTSGDNALRPDRAHGMTMPGATELLPRTAVVDMPET